MGKSPIDNATRPQTPERLLLLMCLFMFTAATFLWYLTWVNGYRVIPTACNVVSLCNGNIPLYSEFLQVDSF